jgi:hypothetical protein
LLIGAARKRDDDRAKFPGIRNLAMFIHPSKVSGSLKPLVEIVI